MHLPTRTHSAYEGIRSLALALGQGSKLPTFLALCEEFHVSKVTLDRALLQLERDDIITRRRGSGIYVSQRMRKNVVLLCTPRPFHDSGHSSFWDMLVKYSQQRASAHHESFSFHFTNREDEGGFLQPGLCEEILAGRVHGIIGILDQASTDWLAQQHVPLVSIFTSSKYSVTFDIPELIGSGVRALAGQGCRTIGLWQPTSATQVPEEALAYARPTAEAFRASLSAVSLAFDTRLVYQAVFEKVAAHAAQRKWDLSNREQGYHAAIKAFGAPKSGAKADLPDGILVLDDKMAQGMLLAMNKLNLKAGRDFVMATHANANSGSLLGHEDDLILLEASPLELVQAAFSMLETLMAGGTPENSLVLLGHAVRLPPGRSSPAA